MAAEPSAVTADAMEREYVAHRSWVLAMLHADFPGLPDPEELYQEAWAEALEKRARGEAIQNLPGLLRTIAWRRARDRVRKRNPAPLDPSSRVLTSVAEPGELDEQVATRLDTAVIRQVVASLTPREAAVIKLRFDCDLSSQEIQRRLGVSEKRLEKITTRVYQAIEQALTAPNGDPAPWRLHQRSVLLSCETGIASRRQRDEARRMLEDDPVCRAMLAEIRTTLRSVAAVLPLPAFLEQASSPSWFAHLRDGIGHRLGLLRDEIVDWLSRLAGHSPTVEQASASGAASLAGGVALKAVVFCVAVGGSTVVCLQSGILPGRGPDPPAQAKTRLPLRPRQPIRDVPPPRPTLPLTASKPARASAPRHAEHKVARAPVSAPPSPSPAPAGSTEFEPSGNSSGASSTPAAAPAESKEFEP